MTDVPTFGVVIPVHDRPDELARAVRSVLAQTTPAAQIVVVDDASSPPLDPVEGIDWVRLPQNLGAAAARDEGVRRLRTEWVAFLDSDDQWRPDHLRSIARAIARRPDAVAVVTGFAAHHPDGRVVDVVPAFGPRPAQQLRRLEARPLTSSALATTVELCRLERFDDGLGVLEDLSFAYRLALRGPIATVGSITVDKESGRPDRLYDIRREATARRALVELWGDQLAIDPVARRRQRRLITLRSLQARVAEGHRLTSVERARATTSRTYFAVVERLGTRAGRLAHERDRLLRRAPDPPAGRRL